MAQDRTEILKAPPRVPVDPGTETAILAAKRPLQSRRGTRDPDGWDPSRRSRPMAISAAIGTPLGACLAQAVDANPALKDAAAVIAAVARSAAEISERIGRGALGGDLAAAGDHNSDGDVQKALDVIAHESVTAALRGAPVAEVASEEAEEVMRLNPDAPLAVAIDPLDGSSNIGVNMAVGMIFGIRPSIKDPANPLASFTTPGSTQIAAGFVTYGPATALILTLGNVTQSYVLDRAECTFKLTSPAM